MRKYNKNNDWLTNVYDFFISRIHSSILCLKYPFLYPRNRFDDCHYSSYTMDRLFRKVKNKIAKLQEDEANAKNSKNKLLKVKFRKKLAECWYKILKFHYYYTLQAIHFIPDYTELDAMEPGWRKVFGEQICKEIKNTLLEEGGKKALREFRIIQIKEKFGGLRLYTSAAPKRVYEIIRSYECISYYTCGNCGANAMYHTRPWIYPLCKDCITDKQKKNAVIIADNSNEL